MRIDYTYSFHNVCKILQEFFLKNIFLLFSEFCKREGNILCMLFLLPNTILFILFWSLIQNLVIGQSRQRQQNAHNKLTLAKPAVSKIFLPILRSHGFPTYIKDLLTLSSTNKLKHY